MINSVKSIAKTLQIGMAALLIVSLPSFAQEAATEEGPKTRAMGASLEATVVDVDREAQQVSLKSPVGNIVTLTIPPEVATLENVKVGDTVEVSEKSRKVQSIIDSLDALVRRGLPQWIAVEKEKFKGEIKSFPVREDLTLPMQEQLIVELYSK